MSWQPFLEPFPGTSTHSFWQLHLLSGENIKFSQTSLKAMDFRPVSVRQPGLVVLTHWPQFWEHAVSSQNRAQPLAAAKGAVALMMMMASLIKVGPNIFGYVMLGTLYVFWILEDYLLVNAA
ncbi:hypothetical protein F5Y05DRAFT_413146 [Hypoxylon sp. FL0543]|nr:hypothetical protein F5Y05DRAFT_413146 [Hypoxylon sp. FL0543]